MRYLLFVILTVKKGSDRFYLSLIASKSAEDARQRLSFMSWTTSCSDLLGPGAWNECIVLRVELIWIAARRQCSHVGHSVSDVVQLTATCDKRLIRNCIILRTDILVHGRYVTSLKRLEAISSGGAG